MNLKHLEIFHHFCLSRSMKEAAKRLNVTQPAVSQQLKTFEEECGVKLFYREANQYKLTEMGETAFLLTKRIFARVGQIETLLSKERKGTQERLRIGSTKGYARTVMPDLVAEFQHQFPKVQVRLSEGNSADLIQRLRNRKEDLVVVKRTTYDSTLKAIPFARADFILVARPDHPLAQSETVSINDLSGESLIIREHGSGSRDAILRKLNQFDVKPSVLVESESLSFILAYIELRMGVSFILSHEIEQELAAGILKQINLREGNISFHADILTRRDEPLSVPMRYFIKIAKSRREGLPA
ncbi:MAG: LysR family transcriptional regulator [Deltaproteobacteria bacterium]|nr:LysR family transcriptional regulator [Deltaproteobacteria bacterium]